MNPIEAYKERSAFWSSKFQRSDRLHRRIGIGRLCAAAVALAVIWWVEEQAPAFLWPTIGALVWAFIATSFILARQERFHEFAALLVSFYSDAIHGKTRKKKPSQIPTDLEIDDGHPFARDLDIVGPDGLFERVTIANSREGMQELLKMLTTPASAETIARRRAAIEELKPRLAFREELYVQGSLKVPYVRTRQILSWAHARILPVPDWLAPLCCGFAIAAMLSAAYVAIAPSPAMFSTFIFCLAAEAILWRLSKKRLRPPAFSAEHLHRDFAELRAMVRVIENHEFESELLQELQAKLKEGGNASRLLSDLCLRVDLHEARRNQLVALLGPLVLYGTQVSLALERWRAAHGRRMRDWVEAVAKFEALSSLACFAFERTDTVFPEVRTDSVVFRAEGLAHPLLPSTAIANDVALDAERNVLVVSGANMAGKSTLLRTIGTSLALTYAGAPVRATAITLAPMAVIASIRVSDSLQKGESRFSAELKRIRLMLESIRQGEPTLLLIDELFGGTNSYDRFAGAAALGEYLAGCGNALAVLSTHDRNITQWVEQRKNGIANAHFEDVFADGTMTFDYRLIPGPASRGNAVELMRAAGIPVTRNPEETSSGEAD